MPKKSKPSLEEAIFAIQSDITSLKKNVLTKEDAKNFLTKDDAKNFATKDDLKAFATKDDLKAFATKDDLKALNAHNIRIEKNLVELQHTVEKKLTNLNSLFVEKLDPFLKRVKIAEEENVILQAKEEGRREIRKGLENRLDRIENHLGLPPIPNN